jgi:hypothetical protein
MKGKYHTVLLFFLFCFFSYTGSALIPPSFNGSSKGVRLGFGPVLGFYTVNQHHTRNPIQRVSGMVCFKKEKRMGRDYRSFFLFGFDYFFHGLTFQSYYFMPDSLKLYDQSFGYRYSLFIHELNIPVQFKYSFKRENNNLFSPYLMIGYHLRYLLPGHLNITKDGTLVKSDEPGLRFEHPLISDKMNAFVSATLGWQKNNTASSRRGFYVELNYRYGFSSYYFERDYAPTSLFTNSTHLALLLGLKF